jgi:maltose O-acetyltransferase
MKNSVVGGNPAKFICSLEDYLNKQKQLLSDNPNFDNSYSIDKNITQKRKEEMNRMLENTIGFRF